MAEKESLTHDQRDILARWAKERLSMPIGLRLPLSIGIGGVAGLLLGISKGATEAGFVYQAENAHRLPTTQTGWYFYHKSKNYNMMFGGIKQGFRQSIRYGIWVGLYFILEEEIDRGRALGSRLWRKFRNGPQHELHGEIDGIDLHRGTDCLSSMLAGLGIAGIFSAWNRFPIPTTARTAKMGAKAGLAFGVLQDAVSLLRGRRVGYVEFIKEHTFGGYSTPGSELQT